MREKKIERILLGSIVGFFLVVIFFGLQLVDHDNHCVARIMYDAVTK